MISGLVLVVLAFFLAYRYLRQHYQLFERDGLPGPPPSMLIGNLALFAKYKEDHLAAFVDLSQKYGKVFGYYEGLTPSIVVSDPDLIEQILVKHFHKFDGRPRCWPFLHGAEHFALQNINGPRWKRHREVIAGAFRTSNIRQMWPRLQSAAKRYVTKLEEELSKHPDGFNIVGINEGYSLEAFTSAAFGLDPASLSSEERESLLLYMRSTHSSAAADNIPSALSRVYPCLMPVLKLFDTDHRRHAMRHFSKIASRLISEKAQMTEGKRPNNLLQWLLSSRRRHTDSTNNTVYTEYPQQEIQGMVSSLFGGGLGPASAALDFAVYCLAMHPSHQDKIRQEIKAVWDTRSQESLTMDDVQSMEQLDMFLNETLRHYPVAPGVARTCCEDCVVGGVQFRKDTVVRLMGSVQYRDPSVFHQPHLFLPHRFSQEERDRRHPYNFLPFGKGPRTCVARRLGVLQVKLALVSLLARFVLLPCPLTQSPLPLALRPFLCPRDGVWVTLAEPGA